jgi:hypothetical protein
MIAASASEMVPNTPQSAANEVLLNNFLDWSSRVFDKLNSQGSLLGRDLGPDSLSLEKLVSQHERQDPALKAAIQRAASFPRPIAMNPSYTQAKGFVNDFGNSAKPAKPKVRGRFSATRRKEVKEVRKRGACIRCRMLKKPVRIKAPSFYFYNS